jgi:virulence-associated protein VagC
MFFKGNNLIGLMPANIKGDTLFSHGGLTFGGIVSNHRMTAHLMLKIFAVLREYLRSEGVEKIVYKVIPHIYHSVAAEEDLYALFRNNAKLFRRDIASAIYLPEKISFQETRLRCIKKAESANVKVKKVDDFKTYWKILEENLAKRHNTKPTHSIEEIECLHNKFPNNIKLLLLIKMTKCWQE